MEVVKLFSQKFAEIAATVSGPIFEDEDTTVEEPVQSKTIDNKSEVLKNLSCSYCLVEFNDSLQQREHYKLDWHRYNLKQSLLKRERITEEQFNERTDDLSSISGSDSENEETLARISIAEGKMFLKTSQNQCFSLYRVLLADKKIDINSSLIKVQINELHTKDQWTIIMLGGGHFAAAVFKNDVPILHKTFHCYTVRAGQGGSQSSRDNKTATAPKSAGASLRRYNEAALAQHVNDIMVTWNNEIIGSNLIFIRAPGPYNKSVLFGGKIPLLNRGDPRIRTVPFSTRRATFKEVQRVYGLLTTINFYESVEYAQSQSPFRSKVKNTSIKRDKSREIIQRALPTDVVSSDSSDFNQAHLNDFELQVNTLEISFDESLQPFGDSLTPEERKRRTKKPKKSKSQKLQEREKLRKQNLHDCIINGNLDSLKEQLNIENVIDDDLNKIINQVIDDEGNSLMHVAAIAKQNKVLSYLLEIGANVCARNTRLQTPYTVTQDKEIRELFKQFAIDNPDKFNYNKANIPTVTSKLTPEEIAEKKRLQRKAKREKEKEKLQVKKKEMQEKQAKERFTGLSDREKRALAAERRILDQEGVVISRCFLCGSNMAGKVPFEYSSNRFCSIDCLKAHRFKNPIVLS